MVKYFCIVLLILLSSKSFAAKSEMKVFTQSFTVTSEFNSRPIKIQVDIDGDSAKVRTFTRVDRQWLEISKVYRTQGEQSHVLGYPLHILAKKFFLSKEGGKPKLYFIGRNNILQQIIWKTQDAHTPTPPRVEISPLVKMGRFTDFTIGQKSIFGQQYVYRKNSKPVIGNDYVTPITLFTPGSESGEAWLASEKFGSAMKLADIIGDPETMKPIALNFDEKLPGNLAFVTGLSKPFDFFKTASPWIDPMSGKNALGPSFPVTDPKGGFMLFKTILRNRNASNTQEEYVLDARSQSLENTFSEKLLPHFERNLRTSEGNMDLEAARALIQLRAHSDQMIPALTEIALQPENETTLWAETPMPKGQIIDRSTEAVDLLAKYTEIDPKALTALQKIESESRSQSARKRATASIKTIKDRKPSLEFIECFMSYLRLLGPDNSF